MRMKRPMTLMKIEGWFVRWPPLARDLVVALSAISLAVGGRLTLDRVIEGAVPFPLTFPAVIAAGLIGGMRAGLLAIAGCQLLVWYFILPVRGSFAFSTTGDLVSLILTTLSQLVAVWAVATYRQSAIRLREEAQRREELLTVALQEIDHRTRNNFQIASSLLMAQASGAGAGPVADELRLAAARISSIGSTYKNLALSSATLSDVKLHEHLREMCERLQDGMLPSTTRLELEEDEVTIVAEIAVTIGLIVNEWITNSAKYAYPDSIGTIRVKLSKLPDRVQVSVSDQGKGTAPKRDPKTKGIGADLVGMLAESIGADVTVETGGGTRCMLTLHHD